MTASRKPILFVLTSHATKGEGGDPTGYYLSEVTHPLAVFDAAELPVAFASILGGEPPVDGLDLTDATNARYWNDARFRDALRVSAKLADVDPASYSAIFYPGGHGAMWDLPGNPDVEEKTRAVWESGGVVGAVCHGPAALVDVTLSDSRYLVAGRSVSAFTDSEERAVGLQDVVPFLLSTRLAQRGAHLKGGADWSSTVAVDGRLVTGQNPQSATAVAEAIRDLLV